MKKLLLLCLACLLCFFALVANAEEAGEMGTRSPLDWRISMQPEPTEEEREAARWSVVMENKLGVYAYDMSSLAYADGKEGAAGKNIIAVLTKTVFTDKETLKKLNAQYKDRLAKKEKVQHCEILMSFNLAEKTYSVNYMDVYGSKKTLLQHTEREGNFVPVPEKSFAEAMLEICQQAASADEQEAAAGNAAAMAAGK